MESTKMESTKMDNMETESKIKEYIESFNPLEKIAYDIAISRLKTSFDIEKSIGFKNSK